MNTTCFDPLITTLPIEIWDVISNKCDIRSQLNMIESCKYFEQSLFVYDLYYDYDPRLTHLTDDILRQKKYDKLIKLFLLNNKDITNSSLKPTLKVLKISGHKCVSPIDQNGIYHLKLEKLSITDSGTIYEYFAYERNIKIT